MGRGGAGYGIIFGLSGILTGCAGPTTPLGSVDHLVPKKTSLGFRLQREEAKAGSPQPAVAGRLDSTIEFSPKRQNLHNSTPFAITINEPHGTLDEYALRILYNGVDVTDSFLRFSRTRRLHERRQIRIEMPYLRLTPRKNHFIEVAYRNHRSKAEIYATYQAPRCQVFQSDNRVLSTEPFNPPQRLLDQIETLTVADGFNPAYFTALIARESSFNARTVSWQKAIGLTQITPVAEKEIIRSFPQWPRYPRINRRSVAWIRTLIRSRKITPKNEWRLNRLKSIRGGMHFTRILSDRWSTRSNRKLLRRLFAHPEDERTRLILASYHSGYHRIHRTLQKYGRNWLNARYLRETRKYVNQIVSYCYHFSEV